MGRSVTEALIYSAVRTPVGRHGGALAGVRPDDLAALVLKAAVERVGYDPARLDGVTLAGFDGLRQIGRASCRERV